MNSEGYNRENDRNEDEEEQQRRWREIYGDMIPERIVDTKIGEVRIFIEINSFSTVMSF